MRTGPNLRVHITLEANMVALVRQVEKLRETGKEKQLALPTSQIETQTEKNIQMKKHGGEETRGCCCS